MFRRGTKPEFGFGDEGKLKSEAPRSSLSTSSSPSSESECGRFFELVVVGVSGNEARRRLLAAFLAAGEGASLVDLTTLLPVELRVTRRKLMLMAFAKDTKWKSKFQF